MQINKDKLVSSKTALAMHELRIYIPSLFWYDKLGGLHTEKTAVILLIICVVARPCWSAFSI